MKIILAAIDVKLYDAFLKHCKDCEIVFRSILDLEFDAIVSPANSFGFMTGGIDELYVKHFGPHIQERLQETIKVQHCGELPVGSAVNVPIKERLETPGFPVLVSAPTMRTPCKLPHDTINPYLATRAALLRCYLSFKRDRSFTIAFPGMGSGIGGVPYNKVACQMNCAIQQFTNRSFPKTLREASIQEERLRT